MLAQLQQQLSGVYDFEVRYPIDDFLLHDPVHAAVLAGESFQQAPEQLLVAETNGELELSLFLHQELMDALNDDSPSDRLHAANLNCFLMAVEGVSHFVHTAWHASHDRPITQLELELIAEVDKFLSTVSLINQQQQGTSAAAIHQTLFNNIQIRSTLDSSVKDRYQLANKLARQYCAHLERHHTVESQSSSLLRELRRFCRLSKSEKIRRISRHH